MPYCHPIPDPDCPICQRYLADAAFRAVIDQVPAHGKRVKSTRPRRQPEAKQKDKSRKLAPLPCLNLGEPTGEVVQCKTCQGSVKLKTFACKVHGSCTVAKQVPGVAGCVGCKDRQEPSRIVVNMGAGGIGDGLLGLLAVGGLRKDRPGKNITYRVSPLARPFVELFDGGYDILDLNDWDNGGHNTPRTGDLQANEGYLDEQGNGYPISRVERYAKNIGASSHVLPTLREPDRLRSLGTQYAGAVFLVTESTDRLRTLSFAVGRKVQSLLESKGYRVVAINDHWQVDELAGAFLNAACVVSVDTGLAHLAAIMGVPTVVLGGHMPVARIFGAYLSARFVQADSLANINPAQVLAEVDGLWHTITAGRSLVSVDRLTVIRDCVLATNHLPGDVAELGVFRGGTAKLIGYYAPAATLHLFDTFAGIPEDDAAEGGHHKAGEFACGLDDVRAFLDNPRAEFYAGKFSRPATCPNRYRFAHIDGDTYQTTAAAIAYFSPRMVAGGMIVFDDYGWHHCPGVKLAIEEAGLIAEVRTVNQCVVRF